jgi:hypothetical protein
MLSLVPCGGYPVERVSIATDGTQGNDQSYGPYIDWSGQFVAFHSLATNLVTGDTNGVSDGFVRDRDAGATERTSLASDGTQANNYTHQTPISWDGRYIAFDATASNLVPGDTNGVYDVFVHDRDTGDTERVSLSSGGAQGNARSAYPAISGDGRYVSFASEASNLVPGDTNGVWDIFRHDRVTGETVRVSVASDESQANGLSMVGYLSPDGRYVAFDSVASNLVPGDTNGVQDVFVRDVDAGETIRISVASDGSQANGLSGWPSSSWEAERVSFVSDATNLVGGDTNSARDVFCHDLITGETVRVSVASTGAQANAPNRSHSPCAISSDGRYVAFASHATNLVAGDTNGVVDGFVRDLDTDRTIRVSVAPDGTQGNATTWECCMSPSGELAGMTSDASNFISGDTNGLTDVFIVDLAPEPIWAESVLCPVGGWDNLGALLGPPDDVYAWTDNADTTPWIGQDLSEGAAVWLDFGRVVHGGTIVVYHEDPGEHLTSLPVGLWWSTTSVPYPVPTCADGGASPLYGNAQGTGVVSIHITPRDFRYLRLDHFTNDVALQDGVDAVGIIEGDPLGGGISLDPPPAAVDPPLHAVSQVNNGYWSNPDAIVGEPDGVYAWSSNPGHTMPSIVVDLGEVVCSGEIVLHHAKIAPLHSHLQVRINSDEYDDDPNTQPEVNPYDPVGWEQLMGGTEPPGATVIQFPPTHFRYIKLTHSQTSGGQHDGVDAVEVRKSSTRLADYLTQDWAQWCHMSCIAMLMSQHDVVAEYGSYAQPLKPYDLAAQLDLPDWRDVFPFGQRRSLKDVLHYEYGLTLESASYGARLPWEAGRWGQGELDAFWDHLDALLDQALAVVVGLGNPVGHAVVVVGSDETGVYIHDPSPEPGLAPFLPDESLQPGMYVLSRESMSDIVRDCVTATLEWISAPEPARAQARPSIWVAGGSLFFVNEDTHQDTLTFRWNGRYPFGYWHDALDWRERLARQCDKVLGFGAFADESMALFVGVANPYPTNQQFTISAKITNLADDSVRFESQTQLFPVDAVSKDSLPLIFPWTESLMLQDYLPVQQLGEDGGSPVGEYLLCLELRSAGSLQDSLCIRFKVVEPALWPWQ